MGHDLASDCTACHGEGKVAPAFNKIHTGYDKAIYTADGMKYLGCRYRHH